MNELNISHLRKAISDPNVLKEFGCDEIITPESESHDETEVTVYPSSGIFMTSRKAIPLLGIFKIIGGLIHRDNMDKIKFEPCVENGMKCLYMFFQF